MCRLGKQPCQETPNPGAEVEASQGKCSLSGELIMDGEERAGCSTQRDSKDHIREEGKNTVEAFQYYYCPQDRR